MCCCVCEIVTTAVQTSWLTWSLFRMDIGSSYISSCRQASQGLGPELTNKTSLSLYSTRTRHVGSVGGKPQPTMTTMSILDGLHRLATALIRPDKIIKIQSLSLYIFSLDAVCCPGAAWKRRVSCVTNTFWLLFGYIIIGYVFVCGFGSLR